MTHNHGYGTQAKKQGAAYYDPRASRAVPARIVAMVEAVGAYAGRSCTEAEGNAPDSPKVDDVRSPPTPDGYGSSSARDRRVVDLTDISDGIRTNSKERAVDDTHRAPDLYESVKIRAAMQTIVSLQQGADGFTYAVSQLEKVVHDWKRFPVQVLRAVDPRGYEDYRAVKYRGLAPGKLPDMRRRREAYAFAAKRLLEMAYQVPGL